MLLLKIPDNHTIAKTLKIIVLYNHAIVKIHENHAIVSK